MEKDLNQLQTLEILGILKIRFQNNKKRHVDVDWEQVELKLKSSPHKLYSLYQMETTGGEPDVVGMDHQTNEIKFFDCSIESPKGRRSLCYDNKALETRKLHKPKNSAVNMASEMGVELLNKNEYRELQKLGEFDSKTSSWLKTPDEIHKLNGAIFGDFRFNTVFVYHNGVQSYYAGRGFRASLRI
ncbi:DUF4256 domain-containing protein [Aequorivita sp. KMM 9714]|uniref:DUF4256 domain-containing protein n=1 Tax=Aequorivita sp. KMM 9714 TaxID=2707173 RepID=UPI0013EA698B|nr:DUF4256 domain-containing protein [Aequorivita sp. KMM 9714]NGX83907.1 DUF4256 domain-containing protein [Aequorivita sp. KMM 9714]